ncbi:sigma-70 domain-containing protein [Kitasatospora hibisci]|uniref:sigma-70 domain-containing protein n=1 Tax=Kitasatospora hibisci TaxID=3369522 RepID=UPI0037540137
MVEVINRVARARRELAQELDREPSPAEIAAATGLTPERVVEVRRYDLAPVSLHTPVGEEGGAELGDLIEDTGSPEPLQALNNVLLREQLRKVLSGLSEREAGVIVLRYGLDGGEPRTLDQIGRLHGVTRERIRQVEAKTMGKPRHSSRTRLLEGFLA